MCACRKMGMHLKVAADVWLTAAAVLAVAAASCPAAAAAAAAAAPDSEDYIMNGEDGLANIKDLTGLNFSGIAYGADTFIDLMDLMHSELRTGNKMFKNNDSSLLETNDPNQRSFWIKFVYPYLYKDFPKCNTPKPFPPKNLSFVPSPAALCSLYDAALYFVDVIVPRQKPEFVQNVIPEALEVSKNTVRFCPWRIGSLVTLCSGPVTFVLLLLTTVIHLFVACISAGQGRCRDRPERRPFDRRNEGQFKCCLGFLVLATMAFYIYGLWVFQKAELQFENGVKNITVAICNFTRSLSQFLQLKTKALYLRSSPTEPLPTTSIPYDGYNSLRDDWWIYNGYPITSLLHRHRSAVTSLSNIAGQLDDVQHDLRELKKHSASLCSLTDQLNKGLSEVKRSLLRSLGACDLPACVELERKHHILEFNIYVPHVQVPDVSEVLRAVTEWGDRRLRSEIADGRRTYDHVQSKLSGYRVHQYGHYDEALLITWKMGNNFLHRYWLWSQSFHNTTENFEKFRSRTLMQLPNVNATFILVLNVLSMPLLILLGLPHCFCGSRPNRKTIQGCEEKSKCVSFWSRSIGSYYIYGVIVLSGISYLFCAIVAVIFFIMGTLLQRGVCDPLLNPRNSTMLRLLDDYVDLEGTVFKEEANHSSGFKLSTVYQQMTNPTSNRNYLYWVFQIDRLAREKKYHSLLNRTLLRSLEEMQSAPPEDVLPAPVTILSDSSKLNLRKLGDIRFSDLRINRISTSLKKNILQFTKASRKMTLLAGTLEQAAASVAANGGTLLLEPRAIAAGDGTVPVEPRTTAAGFLSAAADDGGAVFEPLVTSSDLLSSADAGDGAVPAEHRAITHELFSGADAGGDSVSAELRAAAAALLALRRDIILPMFQSAHELDETANRLQESLRFNGSRTSLKRTIEGHLNEVAESERFINEEINEKARQVLIQSMKNITIKLKNVYRNYVMRHVPRSTYLLKHVERTRLVLCENILLPIHGIWLSMVACCLLLLVLLLVSRNLARSCLHREPYPGPDVVRAYEEVKRFERKVRRVRGSVVAGDACNLCLRASANSVQPRDRFMCCNKR